MAMTFTRLRGEGSGSSGVNFVHLILRVLQFLIGLVVLIMYATQPSYQQWHNAFGYGQPHWALGIAAGALAVATTPFLALIPFFVGYRIVAFAGVWDLCVMAVYAATFAYFKTRFPYGALGDLAKTIYHNDFKISNGRVDVMRAAVTVDLVGMILWIITLLMAIVMVVMAVFGRGRSSRY